MTRFWFFDLDGTLADTDRDIRLAWRAAMEDLSLDCPDFDRRFVAGPPIEAMLKTLFPERYTEELASAMRERFGAHYDGDGFPNTREYPGVADAVRRLRAAGGRTFIVTNKRHAGATAMWRHFGWGGLFEALYAGDMYAADPKVGKLAKPALLAKAMAETGADASVSAMVGDTSSDFEAARACGIKSVAVAWGYGRPDELAMADRTVRSAAEI